jgi:transposase
MMKLMSYRDARSLDHATLEEMRRLAVKRVLAGESQVSVAASLEVDKHTVSKWMRRFRSDGESGLASRKASGRPRTLSEKQQEHLRRIIVGKNPRQLNFGPALWTLNLVGALIEQLFGVVHHASTVSRLLHALGLTPQKPIRRAFQRDEEECRRWMTIAFPEIVREAKRMQATLLFEDETGIHENAPVGRTWGPRGETPVVAVKGSRRRVNVISAVSPRGRLWFRCYSGNLTAVLFVEFLQALLGDTKKRLVLILDSHPAHVAAYTRRFIHENRRRLQVHFLPGYAPDLNPDEHVWSYIKGAFRGDPLEQDEKLEVAVTDAMEKLRSTPKIVKSFFDHPGVRYVKTALSW